MRRLSFALLALAGCSSQDRAWFPLPTEDTLLFLVTVTAEKGPELTGRFAPDDPRLFWSLEGPSDEAYLIAFDEADLAQLSPKLDRARWRELELELGPEACPVTSLDPLSERRPLPLDSPTFTPDFDAEAWTPVKLPSVIAERMALVLPLDPTACGATVPRLEPFARLTDGFQGHGRTHQLDSELDAKNVFRFRAVRALRGGAVLAVSHFYLYWLEPGRQLDTARPGEVLHSLDIEGLPEADYWIFRDLERVPGEDSVFVAAMNGAVGESGPGAVVEVRTGTAGFVSARVLAVAPAGLDQIAVDDDGRYLAAGRQNVLVAADSVDAAPEIKRLQGQGNVTLASPTHRADLPFVVADSGGALGMLDPWRDRFEPLGGAQLDGGGVGLAVQRGVPTRIDLLRYNALLYTWEDPGPAQSQQVPVPSELGDCAVRGELCEPHLLGPNPGAMIRIDGRGLLVAPYGCDRIYSWSAADECLVAWENDARIPAGAGFAGFEALDELDGRVIAAGSGGFVYQSRID